MSKNIILALSITLYFFCAINNTGYYHYDEHFQIIEFAEFKSGNNIASDLAWEYEAQIRSSLQPTIAYIFLESFRYLGVRNPFTLMVILRLLMVCVSISIINMFVNRTEFMINPNFKTIYRLLSYFLWFLPFINCRFSSETVSGLTFLLALSVYFSNSNPKFYWMGILLCLSFLFRFQTAFMSIGFLAWLIFVEKLHSKKIVNIMLGIALTLLCGVLIDYWYYRDITLTFSNYFQANIVNNVASSYGISPWNYYFIEVIKQSILPIGIVIWLSVIWLFIYRPKNFVIWIFIPFLLVHIITPHKEIRFLFPFVNLIPLLLSLFIANIHGKEGNKGIKNWVLKVCLFFLGTINILALVPVMFSTADEDGRMNIIEVINNRYPNKAVALWVTDYNNPYKPIPVAQNFYENKNVTAVYVDSLTPIKFQPQFINLVSIKKDKLQGYKALNEFKVVEIAIGKPAWLVNFINTLGMHSNPMVLLEIKTK